MVLGPLSIRFVVRLENDNRTHFGPSFHRWLPNGEIDALLFNTKDSNCLIKIWFERRGFMDGDFISFSYNRKEINPDVISKQGWLDGGPLFGIIRMIGIPDQELSIIKNDQVGEKYKSFVKNIIKKYFYPTISFS